MENRRYYALVVEYQGSRYCGWQRQNHSLGVQEVLERALSFIADENIVVVCAGRTDAGVHATAQVVSFMTTKWRDAKAWTLGVNSRLPKDVKVVAFHEVDAGFSARFSAIYRRYNYVLYESSYSSALFDPLTSWVRKPLNIELMNEACQYLLGEQDFSSFRAAECQSNSPYRRIDSARFHRYGRFVIFDIKGNAFLHHMVRNIVGSMLEIGLNHRSPDWVKTLLLLKDRRLAAKTAPANGLYLVEVGYPQVVMPEIRRDLMDFLGG
ncbi:MAG: tRNA pseudouridine(38-40) synthase TruA [Francisellaceae bacterium]